MLQNILGKITGTVGGLLSGANKTLDALGITAPVGKLIIAAVVGLAVLIVIF